MMEKLILHVPHSSVCFPDKEGFICSDQVLSEEILKVTDWHTDDLFYSEKDIAVVAPFSRIYCDPERFVDDDQEPMSKLGMGVLYEQNDAGEVIRKVDAETRERILHQFYYPHHGRLLSAVVHQLQNSGKACIIDCHSYPDVPLRRDISKDTPRPDFNIGTDPFHTPGFLTDAAINFFYRKGFTLGLDWPYSGSLVPVKHYKTDPRVFSLMLEVNRRLYMNEQTAERSERYEEIKSVIGEFLMMIRTTIS